MKYTVLADLTVGVRFEVEADSEEEAIEKATSLEVVTLAQENMLEVCYDEDIEDISIDCDMADYDNISCEECEEEDE